MLTSIAVLCIAASTTAGGITLIVNGVQYGDKEPFMCGILFTLSGLAATTLSILDLCI